MKIQIKRDETSKDTKNHLKFKKKLRRTLMQRAENRWNADRIDGKLSEFADFDPLLDWDFRPICGCEVKGVEGIFYNVKHNKLLMMLLKRKKYGIEKCGRFMRKVY